MQIFEMEMPKAAAGALFKPQSSLFRSLLTIEEAADYLGMSAKWLYRNYRDLPHVKIGGGTKPRIRFKSADLDGWIAAHTCDWRKA